MIAASNTVKKQTDGEIVDTVCKDALVEHDHSLSEHAHLFASIFDKFCVGTIDLGASNADVDYSKSKDFINRRFSGDGCAAVQIVPQLR